MTTPAIVNWKVIGPNGAYTRPDAPKGRVAGIEGISGAPIVISTVVSADGRTVTTRSGSKYELMDAHLAYQNWCAAKGIVVDWECPVPGVSS